MSASVACPRETVAVAVVARELLSATRRKHRPLRDTLARIVCSLSRRRRGVRKPS
ncbi:hypothetical protein AKJ09_11456 [Labilithrix luteola]|uniref:Uncharacterized protein n=1 Tax=Labilithrix luteola TaxID=1391654 RepID=A0A0K1QGE7_9BACT|nr:hypothetical protein AKJ09_11456 [Labilithrix luteola]